MKYKPRLTPPSKTDPNYFSKKNIFYASGYGMPNCTAYAYGRLLENTNKSFSKLTGNGGKWFEQAKKAGYQTGNTPKLGAVACWKSNGAGHIAIVEQIYSNGDILCSNSAWKGTFFYTTTHNANKRYNYNGYTFLGFIYCGVEFDADTDYTQIAEEVIQGKWGSGEIRRTKLREAGYDPTKVQEQVNKMLLSKR